ncbi:MAG: hypothetical protein HKO09_03515 [Croceitalea sp.]|nr:hypothetical protein [Croceitalea sp.]
MKLTQEQIQSIDTYLKNHDIQFIDVRAELVDHIASDEENRMNQNNQTFYNAFKDYMVENKRTLLKHYESHKKKMLYKSLGVYWKFLKKPKQVLLFTAIFLFLTFFEKFFAFSFPHIKFSWALIFGTMAFYFFATWTKAKNRYSGLESLLWPLTLLGYAMIFLFNITADKPMFYETAPMITNLFTSLIISFNLVFWQLFITTRKKLKTRFFDYALK